MADVPVTEAHRRAAAAALWPSLPPAYLDELTRAAVLQLNRVAQAIADAAAHGHSDGFQDAAERAERAQDAARRPSETAFEAVTRAVALVAEARRSRTLAEERQGPWASREDRERHAVAQVLAGAWSEGYDAGDRDAYLAEQAKAAGSEPPELTPNPYV